MTKTCVSAPSISLFKKMTNYGISYPIDEKILYSIFIVLKDLYIAAVLEEVRHDSAYDYSLFSIL